MVLDSIAFVLARVMPEIQVVHMARRVLLRPNPARELHNPVRGKPPKSLGHRVASCNPLGTLDADAPERRSLLPTD